MTSECCTFVDQLREAFGPGGEYEPCPGSYCPHGECDAARFVLGVIGA